MDGDEVREGDGTEDGLLVLAHQRTVAPHGDGGGDALIAGAGDDDHRHLAAVHAGIAACGGPCAGLGLGVVAALEEVGADVGTPGVLQTFLGNGGVLLNLSADEGLDFFNGYGFGKGDDVCYVQHGLILQAVLRVGGQGLFQQNFVVLLDEYDVGMVVGNTHRGRMAVQLAVEADVQHTGRFGAGDLDGGAVQICLNATHILFCYVGNDLQFRVSVACHNTHCDGGVDAATAIGIGNDHRLHVLEDIAADLSQHFFRFSAQHLAQLGSTVRNGDGLCTPGSQQELFLQDGQIGLHFLLVQHHRISFAKFVYMFVCTSLVIAGRGHRPPDSPSRPRSPR